MGVKLLVHRSAAALLLGPSARVEHCNTRQIMDSWARADGGVPLLALRDALPARL